MELEEVEYYTIIDNIFYSILDEIKLYMDKNKNKNIDYILINFLKDYDLSAFDKIIVNNNTLDYIKQIINNYVYSYVFVIFNFNNSLDTLRNAMVKYQNLFENSEKISKIIELFSFIQEFYNYINFTDESTDTTNINIEVLNLYNVFDKSEINLFKDNTEDFKHNIIKSIIILKYYHEQDKKNIFNLLELDDLTTVEFTYIDIVESLVDELDYTTIEKLFLNTDLKYETEFIYQFILEYKEEQKILTNEEKINLLFDSKLLIPITDEFLRYHKDSELYSKNTGVTKIDTREKHTFLDNTKIRYITTKINKLIDFYNLSDKEAEEIYKLYYPSLLYRKAIIINDIEEISIINKLNLLGISIIENNEYYSDLMYYRIYPYINFNSFKKYGFSIKVFNTTDVIRYCNFEYKNKQKYSAQYTHAIQTRIINRNMLANIVGIAINPYKIYDNKRFNTINCIKLQDTITLEKYNGYNSTLELLNNLITNNISYNKLFVWIFSKKNDTINLNYYENILQLNNEDYFKFLVSKIYDEVIILTYNKIAAILSESTYKTFYEYKLLLTNIQNKLIDISNTSYYNNIWNIIYEKLRLKIDNTYDKNENKIPGLTQSIIKLPIYKNLINTTTKIIIKKQEFLVGIKEEAVNELLEYALCQHQVIWTNINKYKKKDPNKFNQELFNFIKQYIVDNEDKEYICKSCNQYVDIQKYIYESFNYSINNVALSIKLEAELENIKEYEKYGKAIKTMEKIVERIGSIINIQQFIGSTPINKYRRQDIIKLAIDIINLQYKTFDISNINMKKERLKLASELYGIDKNKSEYFIFEMDNNLYTYSSKDKDKFKRYKNNNIIAYFVFFILCELNFGQIILFTYDKLINFAIFNKFNFNIFNDLKIIVNNNNDIQPIQNYKLLCYVIYYFSAIIIKYNLWYAENLEPVKTNKINIQLLKSIINTIVDLINCILEVNTRANKSYIYEYVASKFFISLHNIYNNSVSPNILERLANITDKKIVISNNKIVFTSTNSLLRSLEVERHFIITNYNITYINPFYKFKHYKTTKDDYDYITIEELNNFNRLLFLSTLKKIKDCFNTQGIRNNTAYIIRYNIKDEDKTDEDIKYTTSVFKALISNNNKQIKKVISYNNKLIKQADTINIQYNNNIKNYTKANFNIIIKDLIDKMDDILGPKLNINNNNIYLKNTLYIIDHDHLGSPITNITKISDDEDLIEYKYNDLFFKRDIYVYNNKSKNIYIYYDAKLFYLIGYKESTKQITTVSNSGMYLKIEFSIEKKLSLLGHNIIKYDIDSDNFDKHKFIESIIKTRIDNLKQIIKNFHLMLYQIKNNTTTTTFKLVTEFINKFKNLNFYNEDGTQIFNDINMILDSTFYIPITSDININIVNSQFNVDNLIKFNNNDNLLVLYLCDQINLLLKINTNQYNISKLCIFISLAINDLFNKYNYIEKIYRNNEVKKFNLLVTSNITDTYDDINDEIALGQTEQEEEVQYDNYESINALDMDIEMDETFDDTDEGTTMIQSTER